MNTTSNTLKVVGLICTLVVLSLGEGLASEPKPVFNSLRPHKATPGERIRSAAFSGELNEIRKLAGSGASVNAADQDGWTPLFWAEAGRQPEAVKLLLNLGADINARDASGNTALILSAMSDDTEVTDILLAAGADIKAKNRRGWSALMEASFYGRAAQVEVLLAEGADPNEPDKRGYTAFSLAKISNNPHVAALLVANGADPDAQMRKVLASLSGSSRGRDDAGQVRLAGLLRNSESLTALCQECLKLASDDVKNDGLAEAARIVKIAGLDCESYLAIQREERAVATPQYAFRTYPKVGTALARNAHDPADADRLMSDARSMLTRIRSEHPGIDRQLRNAATTDKIYAHAKGEPVLEKALTMWESFRRENPELARRLLNMAGIGR